MGVIINVSKICTHPYENNQQEKQPFSVKPLVKTLGFVLILFYEATDNE